MSVMLQTVALLLLARAAPLAALRHHHDLADCGDPHKAHAGDQCYAAPLSLRPAQFVLGHLEVWCRTTEFEDKYKDGKVRWRGVGVVFWST